MKKIWHPWWKWECAKAGFYSSYADIDSTKEEAQQKYKVFLSNIPLFEKILGKVITEWEYSCDHFLSDLNRNKIAWLGQASMAYYAGIPSDARGGYKLLTDDQQKEADKMARKYLMKWYGNKNKQIQENMEKEGLPRRYTRRSPRKNNESTTSPIV